MRFLSQFVRSVIGSLSEPTFYIHVIRLPFRHSLVFFTVSIIFLTIGSTALLVTRDVHRVTTRVDEETTHILNQLPEETVVTYTQGHVTWDHLPIPFSVSSSSWIRDQGFPSTLAVISQSEDLIPDALLTLTPTQVQTREKSARGNTHVATYSDLWGDASWQLTKDGLEGKRKDMIASLPTQVRTVLLVGLPFIAVGMFVAVFVLLLFLTVFINTMSWMIGVRLPFLKLVQLGLHAMVAGLCVDLLARILFPSLSVSVLIPAYVGIMLLVLFSIRMHVSAATHTKK